MISPTAKPTSVRLGFMGHLTLIAEDVLTALERFRGNRGQPAWDEYVGVAPRDKSARRRAAQREEPRRVCGWVAAAVCKSSNHIGCSMKGCG
jgi:hypothetical protein